MNMKRFFATLAAALALATSAWAQGTAVIYGTLLKYKNPPGLIAELPSAPREYFVVRFEKPFETEHSNWENEDGGRAGKVRVTEIQVDYNGEDSALAALVGKKVIAEGGITERNLARQARALIVSVEPGHIKAGAFMLVPEAGKETE
jgi:hypothetical protein